MLYSLTDTPLHFNNARSLRRRAVTFCLIIAIFAILAISKNYSYLQGGGVERDAAERVIISIAWPWLILPTILLIGVILQSLSPSPEIPGISSTERSMMTIDGQGIFISRGRRNWSYYWRDISSSKIINVRIPGQRFGVVAVQIRVKGRPVVSDYEDLIDGTFGIALTDLNELIRQGIQRWGQPAG